MNTANPNRSNRLFVILGLTMALGPLTALSFGSRFAGEETWERAQAGLQNAEVERMLDRYGQGNSTAADASDPSLQDTLAGAGTFRDFATALRSSGADRLFSRGDSYTLLVPSNSAFDSLSAEQRATLAGDPAALRAVIGRHIIPGRYTATDLMQMSQARTLDAEVIPVGMTAASAGQLSAGGAEVVNSNIFAADGIIHVIDRVIL